MAAFIPIRNSDGATELWLLGGRVIDLSGRSIGFVNGQNLYDYNGAHRGWFIGGVIRDHYGAVSGYIDGATSLTVIRPIPQIDPIHPIPTIEPLRPIPEIAPIRPIPTIAWSDLSPSQLFDV